VLLLAVLLALAACTSGSAGSAQIAAPAFTVVATNLNNPRKLFVGAGGAIYVAEAGTGGHARCLGSGSNETCIGLTGSVTRIEDGAQTRVLTGLVSFANPDEREASGPSDLIVRGGSYDVLLQDTDIDAHGANPFGPDGRTAGALISSPPGRARARVIANLAAFEALHNPDRGAGPGAAFGDPPLDSDPYAFTAYRGGFAVADAAGNDLLWVGPQGTVSLLAVFPTQTEQLTKAIDREIGAPTTLTSLVVQSVPTSVALGPDGALYVGELTGSPFGPGRARIWRVVPGQKLSLYASGFTNISDLAFDGKNLLVLEIASRGLLDAASPGALIRLSPGGRRTVIASAGLVDPTGLAVGGGAIYIANDGIFPGSGSGPHGEVVRLPGSVGS